MRRPLAIELFAGCMTWTAGWRDLGGHAIGFDIEHLPHHGPVPEGGELVLQDVLTLQGSQFRHADVIFASPPCQKYSYLAMPWSRKSKGLRRKWETDGPDNRLFDACFRIQREASAAAGRYIPLIVENVRGAQPWVGRSAWNFGSFHLWGDVPALMPITIKAVKLGGGRSWTGKNGYGSPDYKPFGFNTENENGLKQLHSRGDNQTCGKHRMGLGCGVEAKFDKESGGWFNDYKGDKCVGISRTGSKSSARKAASAMIARIPYALSRHMAEVYWPREYERRSA